MSVSRLVWVMCDGCGEQPDNEPHTTIVEARKAAKEAGFVHLETEMLDYCPDCSKGNR